MHRSVEYVRGEGAKHFLESDHLKLANCVHLVDVIALHCGHSNDNLSGQNNIAESWQLFMNKRTFQGAQEEKIITTDKIDIRSNSLDHLK